MSHFIIFKWIYLLQHCMHVQMVLCSLSFVFIIVSVVYVCWLSRWYINCKYFCENLHSKSWIIFLILSFVPCPSWIVCVGNNCLAPPQLMITYIHSMGNVDSPFLTTGFDFSITLVKTKQRFTNWPFKFFILNVQQDKCNSEAPTLRKRALSCCSN